MLVCVGVCWCVSGCMSLCRVVGMLGVVASTLLRNPNPQTPQNTPPTHSPLGNDAAQVIAPNGGMGYEDISACTG